MLKKTKIALVLSFALILWATPMVFGAELQVDQVPLDQRLGPTHPAIPLEKGFCVIQNDDGSIASYWSGFSAGDGVAAYMDPATCPDPPPYPFRVTDAHFYLYDFTGAVWPVQIDVNVRDLVGNDSCNGPGSILCSETFTIPFDSSEVSLGRPMNLTMSSLCCVNGPFFLEIVYTGGTSSPYPSPLFAGDAPVDTCFNWLLYAGLYYEWYNIWTPPTPGNIILRATGNTHDLDCGEWPNHKMHFPQLPDLEGWDVYAVFPKTLADDWQCSETGEVLDIHFWGSWKDIDGDPETDDFQTPFPFFNLSIHSNLPVGHPDNPFPYSIPGDLLWVWEGEVPGTPFDPPAMEHWYDPNTGEVLYNDHVPYWRYDFFFDQADPPPEPFYQYQDSIYWLNVSAMDIYPPYEWGWKTSRDHFMDDAVFTDNPPGGPWYEMYEPPRANWFDVNFDATGLPQDMGSTNYYGQGWYFYEWYGWWNMWFYDNPYKPDQEKHFSLDFYIEEVGPGAYAEFAINFSTPEWDEMGMGRPPLPQDGEEDLYIERIEYSVNPGPNYIEDWIYWNPEWISIDFRAANVVINGWIWHECVQTSMDLAFVITGEEVSPDTVRNHYKTWWTEPQTFEGTVFVQDQFMEDSLDLLFLMFLSNPVKKVVDSDTFDIIRPDDHLTWYWASGRDTLIEVEYVNQFESTTVVIDFVKFLLVPTQKEQHDPPENLDHYKAYNIQDAADFPVTLVLEDQFDVMYGEPEYIEALWPRYFLTPALKNMEQPQLFDSITHYVAYEIFPKRFFPLSVYTLDQFGEHVLNVEESWMLLVPSKKRIVQPCDPPNIGCPADEIQNQNGVYTTTTQWTADDGNPGNPAINLTSVTVDLANLPPGISAANVNFAGCVPGPGCKSTNGTVTYTVSDHCQSGGPIYLDATNNCPQPNTATCSFVVTLTNDPPTITQPDSLEGFVNSVVQYDITGNDPDGDVINDVASIQIVPECGSYSIIRTSGSGTSSGTWQITWNTFGCTACQTYLVIHDLTDACGDVAYCTTKVHLSEEVGWYWKPDYDDYAPSGMVDIDQRQDAWIKAETEQWTFCGPVAVANCFKWYDSKYNQANPGFPGDMMDQFPLVRQYIDVIGGMICPWDDHDPWNVDHLVTPWLFGATPPPPPTLPQPFVPGPQPPGPMPPWGELVERLAWYLNTDGVQMEYCDHSGTDIMEMQAGIDMWFRSEMFEDSSTLADTLYERTWPQPTFAWVETLVEKCQDVILLLGFWYEDPPGSGEWWRIGGHYVTVAGVNSEEFMIAFSDPFIDAAEMGLAPGRIRDGSIIPHPHGYHDPTIHNDEGNVSHDIYMVVTEPVSPGGLWWLPEYVVMFDPLYWSWNFYNQNVPDEFVGVTAPWNEMSPIYTEVEYAVEISPWEYPPDCGDVNCDGVVNVADVVYLVTWLFQGGPPPCKMVKADVNHDGYFAPIVNIADVVYLVSYLFQNGPPPQCYDP